MPCAILVHIHGTTGKFQAVEDIDPDTGEVTITYVDRNWKPGEIIAVRPKGWKWGKKEKKLFLPLIISDATEAAMLPFQGRKTCIGLNGYENVKAAFVNWESMYDTDGERAAVRNKGIASPKVKAGRGTKLQIETVLKDAE